MSEGVSLESIEKYTGQLLDVGLFRDYAPNGIQIDAARPIRRLATAVTASTEAILQAEAWGADALLVHHGYFWRGEDPRLTGAKFKRVRQMISAGIGLLAYHLPLDAHPELGNNAQLAVKLGIRPEGRFGEQSLGVYGVADTTLTLNELAGRIANRLGRDPVIVGDRTRQVERIGWCTGGAQDYLADAGNAGCNVFITGEASERSYHDAMERGIAFVAAGHHATERYGVQALGEHLAKQFEIECCYFELDNPF